MKIEDMFVEKAILEEEIIQEVTETQPGIKREVGFNRESFAELQLGDKRVIEIVQDDINFPTINDKFNEILKRMDGPSRGYWTKHKDKILKPSS